MNKNIRFIRLEALTNFFWQGLDTQVSSNLSHILRLPFSGPKIAQKYLEDPVLFHRPELGEVKFDIRYIILLKSVQPLQVDFS